LTLVSREIQRRRHPNNFVLNSLYHFRAFLLITGSGRLYVHMYYPYQSWSSSLVWCCLSCIYLLVFFRVLLTSLGFGAPSPPIEPCAFRTLRRTRNPPCKTTCYFNRDSTALPDGRLRRLLLFIFFIASFCHRPPSRKRQHVYPYTSQLYCELRRRD